jgi:hypothetical protein
MPTFTAQILTLPHDSPEAEPAAGSLQIAFSGDDANRGKKKGRVRPPVEKEGHMQLQERHLEQRSSIPLEEAIVAELTETIELQARKLESLTEEVENLRRERVQLAEELHMAHVWIRELAAELQRADLPAPC